jgi:anaerobic selenocysteine-containing dehydrogenase
MATETRRTRKNRPDPAELGRALRMAENATAVSEPFHPDKTSGLHSYPPPDKWDDWVELDPKAWPERVERRYTIVPTICFNCEAACGLLAYVDKETLRIRKLEGNPTHPGSRGRNCAKGPATVNQVYDPERILYPMKRAGKRGEGKWVRTTWDEALDTIATKIRTALVEKRHKEIMYHVGRPGEDGFMEKVLQSWGIDGHNSHTNVCSAAARAGYAFWMGIDRPSPDHTNARFILLISSHLETGHYFNPHAQRIIEGKLKGAKIAVMDPRLSNTASMADYWMPTWPGSEVTVLLAMAKVILDERGYDREFIRKWVNWETYLKAERPDLPQTVDGFIQALQELYAEMTPEYAAQESGVPAEQIVEIARQIAKAGSAFSSHNWRAAGAGNLGGWMVARALYLLNVLTGSIGTEGGTSPNAWDKFVPVPWNKPGPQKVWSDVLWPKEYPLAHHEMSFLLPHIMRDRGAKVSAYFTRVYNPVWTNPDGFAWIEMLRDESVIELHAALTPTWNETTHWADYVLPMGHSHERHDNQSQETHSSRWFGFRQPVVRVAMERMGKHVEFTYEANPGEVWEEDEFMIELSWRIDPDGELGIRKHYESPYRPGEKITVGEHYQWMFENTVPGLPEKAAEEGLTPLEYMRKYGAFEVEKATYNWHEKPVTPDHLTGTAVDPESHLVTRGLNGSAETVGVEVDGEIVAGFPTPSRKLEFYSQTLIDWRWPEYAVPTPVKSHVHPSNIDRGAGEMVLLPNFRLPTLIHTRSANAKWLNEISHSNPAWLHPEDAIRLSVATGDLLKIETGIGYFIAKVWVTEGIRPGIVACSHHMGRWRLTDTGQLNPSTSSLVEMQEADGTFSMRQVQSATAYESDDPDTARVWWGDAGVNQNLTFPVQPDPVSGQHCWLQKVTVTKAGPNDRYGDISVDTAKARRLYEEWLAMTRPAPGPGNLRRPRWLLRPYKPAPETYVFEETR